MFDEVADGQCGEHDRQVGFDRFAFVVVDGSGLQVVFGHAEALLDAPELVVGVDDELGTRAGQVGGVALQFGQGAGFGLQVAVDRFRVGRGQADSLDAVIPYRLLRDAFAGVESQAAFTEAVAVPRGDARASLFYEPIKNFPAYVASGYDPTSQAAQNILAAGYPPDIVNRAVTPVDSLWGHYNTSFWEVTACQWQERCDPTYPTYTSGLGNYDYLSRVHVPGVFDSVAAVETTGKIKKPLITVAGTMDALLPIKRQARAYEAAVNASRKGNNDQRNAQYRLYEVQNGNHIEANVIPFPQLVVIQPHAQKAFDLLVDHVEANSPLPPGQCIPKGGTISPSPLEPGHCVDLFAP